MSTHSPGPWKFHPSKQDPDMGLVRDAEGDEVVQGHCGCCFPGDQHISRADGLLTAEAPEMLELLKKLSGRCGCTLADCPDAQARALLARIEGEP